MTDSPGNLNRKKHILIVDDEIEYCLSLRDLFREAGYRCSYKTDPLEVSDFLHTTDADLILLDLKMPGMSGLELLRIIRIHKSCIPVIIISGHINIETTVQAMQIGAMNVLKKPVRFGRLLREIAPIIESASGTASAPLESASGISIPHATPTRESASGSAAVHKTNGPVSYHESPIICTDPNMLQILSSLKKVAETDATVLITGESGTGKELIADEIHRLSRRAEHPFVKLNCASLPETLLESELFGHTKGAYTGAEKDRPGRFAQADGGGMFLDEIGDMSMMIQAKLLRVLQDKQVTPLGSDKAHTTDVRIIAATNKNLQSMMEEGTFREDLFYRLSVVHFELPPLRERRGDILLMARIFREQACREYGRTITGFDPEVEEILISHQWPGNIRELKNCIQRAVIFCEKEIICKEDLPFHYKDIPRQGWADDYERAIDNINKELIVEALRKTRGKKTAAAQLLNMDRKTLYNKMKKLRMDGRDLS